MDRPLDARRVVNRVRHSMMSALPVPAANAATAPGMMQVIVPRPGRGGAGHTIPRRTTVLHRRGAAGPVRDGLAPGIIVALQS